MERSFLYDEKNCRPEHFLYEKAPGTAVLLGSFLFVCFSVESNQLIEFTGCQGIRRTLLLPFHTLHRHRCSPAEALRWGHWGSRVTIEPNLSVIVLSVFVKRHQNDVILALYFENGNDGTGYIRAVISSSSTVISSSISSNCSLPMDDIAFLKGASERAIIRTCVTVPRTFCKQISCSHEICLQNRRSATL